MGIFSKFKSNPLLMFSMKQAHLYEWIYNKNKELPKEEIYIIALDLLRISLKR